MPRSAAERVRIGRRLRRAGAVTVRAGVYALPDTREARSILATLRSDIDRGHGSALPALIAWLDARVDQQLGARHAEQHDRRRRRLMEHVARLERSLRHGAGLRAADRQTANARLARLRKHLERLSHGAAPVRREARVRTREGANAAPGATGLANRVWVTRRGILVDRIASAWMIRRFIDRGARFRFVGGGDRPAPGELRFDMPEAEFTHQGDRCTFEGLVRRFAPEDDALRQIAEIVHDLDLKDGRFGRVEAAGVGHVITGLAALEPDDAARLARGGSFFDCLYVSLGPGPPPQLPGSSLP